MRNDDFAARARGERFVRVGQLREREGVRDRNDEVAAPCGIGDLLQLHRIVMILRGFYSLTRSNSLSFR